MENKKGFTLVELLAVIVILAIIALVAVPIILNVIEKSKESSAVDSAYSYIHAVEDGVAVLEVNKKIVVSDGEYENLREFETDNEIGIKGTKPNRGFFRLQKRRVVYAELVIDEYSIVCDTKKCESKGKTELITLTYNANGGEVTKKSERIGKGTSAELPTPTREHYGFLGWYTENDERVNNETILNESVTLKAKWKKNTYNVLFDGNGGTPSESSLVANSGETLTLPTSEKEGYTFNGWYTEPVGGELVTDETVFTESKTLYAHYTINIYTINFDAGSGTSSKNSKTVEHGSTLVLPTVTPPEGYTFNGWFTEDNSEVTNSTIWTESKTLYAHYTKNVYTISFNANGGTSSSNSMTVEHGSTLVLPIASREGYAFNGWYTESTGGSAVTNSTIWTSSQTVYAHYTKNIYTITYNKGNGTLSTSSATVEHGNTLTLPTPTAPTYFIFDGWYTGTNGSGTKVTNSTVWTSSQTIYANYIHPTTDFDYTGGIQTYRPSQSGYYRIEAWGAQGGSYASTGGFGGYSVGVVQLTTSSTIYIVVGGKGGNGELYAGGAAGYNGGGAGGTGQRGAYGSAGSGGGGGGATHVSTRSGLLSAQKSYIARLLIVAGGGGGAHALGAGAGGGYVGNSSTGYITSAGGNQSTGYSFGVGQRGVDGVAGGTEEMSGGGGGGGYYGGYSNQGYDRRNSSSTRSSGAGGSGYIANSLLLSNSEVTKHMTCYNCSTSTAATTYTNSTTCHSATATSDCSKEGNGYVKIAYLGS